MFNCGSLPVLCSKDSFQRNGHDCWVDSESEFCGCVRLLPDLLQPCTNILLLRLQEVCILSRDSVYLAGYGNYRSRIGSGIKQLILLPGLSNQTSHFFETAAQDGIV